MILGLGQELKQLRYHKSLAHAIAEEHFSLRLFDIIDSRD